MPEKSIYDLTQYSGIPASTDLFMFVDIDAGTTDKTFKITFGDMTAGLQASSSILTALTNDLPSVNGLVFWNGSAASQIVAGDGISISSGIISANLVAGNGISISGTGAQTIALSKWGIETLLDPSVNSLLLISTGGLASFIQAGSGISFAGDAISLSHLGLESLADPNADKLPFWDDSAGALKWLGIGADAGLRIDGTSLVHDPEPVVVSLRAIAGTSELQDGIATYWTVPAELAGGTLSTVDMGFVSSDGSATVQLARATAGSPTSFSNILTASAIASGWSSYQSGQTQGTGSVTLAAGDRIRVTLSGVSGTPQGLDVFLGCEV